MLKRVLVIVLVLVAFFTPLAAPAMVGAYSSCDRAAWAGWHHPGMNNACLMEIMADIIHGGGWEDP